MFVLLNGAVLTLTGTLVGLLHGDAGLGAMAGLCCFGADLAYWSIVMRTVDDDNP